MLYSKTYCKFSKRIKKLLSNYEIDDMEILELDKQADMKALQVIKLLFFQNVSF